MKTKYNIRKFTEPILYFAMVAAFGFITTVVNHVNREEKIKEAEMVSMSIENELEDLFGQESTASL